MNEELKNQVTTGVFEIVSDASLNPISVRVKDADYVAGMHNCNMSVNGDRNALANAELVCDAFTVFSETGMTPKELAAALETAQREIYDTKH